MAELLEMQGLTPDMVRDCLRGKGWAETANASVWMHGESKATLSVYETELQFTVACLAEHEGRHRQEVAANVNPRLRPGLPSDAAVYAHQPMGGVWIGCHGELGDSGSIVFLSFHRGGTVALWDGEEWHNMETEMSEDLPSWLFWPCDASGNKVLWPVDGNGVML